MVTSFNHTGLVVRDLEKMVRFYTEDLGLKILLEIDSVAPPEGDHTGIAGARRKLVFVGFDDDHRVELVCYIDPPPAGDGHVDSHRYGCMHICFNVADLCQTHKELSAKGVKFHTDPKFREVDGRTLGVIYAQDPEGNWLEFIEGWE